MQDLDVHSVIVLLFWGNLLFACILTIFKSKSIPQRLYRQFITAKILQSVAWLLLGLRGAIPDLFSAYIGNTFLSVGLAFEALALTTIYVQSLRWEIIYTGIALIGILLMWGFGEKPNMRVFISSLNASVIFSVASYALIHSSFNSHLRKTIGVVYGILSIFLIARSVYAFLSDATFGLNSPHFIQSLTFLVTFILMLVSGVSFQLILSEYNDSILEESRKMFHDSIELLPIGCIIADQQGTTKYLNSTFTEQFGYTLNDIPNVQIWFEKAYPDPEYRKLVSKLWITDIERIKNLNVDVEPFVFNIISKNGISHAIEFRQSIIGDLLMVLLIDISVREKAKKALEESEARWKLALLGAGDGVWDWDLKTNQIRYYKQWKEAEKSSEIEMCKSLEEWSKVVHPDDLDKIEPAIQKHLNGETEMYQSIHRLLYPAGKYRWILDRGKIVEYSDDAKPLRMIGTHTDMTERVELEQKLQQLNADKDRFMQILAHDLRSPFTSIVGFSDVLVDQVTEKDYEGIEEYAKIIQQSSRHALELLMSLMEWARSQTGKMEFNPECLDIIDLIKDIAQVFDAIAGQKSILIKKELPRQVLVSADKSMISTIIRNLISNAIKFTNVGGSIIVSAEEKSEELIVSIRDSGIGMSGTTIEKIFRINEFHSTLGTNDEKGTGLGLLLCKEFVEKHGGKIWVESDEGMGSTFYFTLPYNSGIEEKEDI